MMDKLNLFLFGNEWMFFLIAVWTLPWKGVALWRASKNNHKKWFIALLVLNTLAVLEIIYIVFFSKKGQKSTDHES